jgi:4-carboxymuconolactone decarboxylase
MIKSEYAEHRKDQQCDAASDCRLANQYNLSAASETSASIEKYFQGFVNVRDGALLGPWNPWLREPKFGKPVWELTKAMVSQPSLPATVREVAILATGSQFRSAYAL